MESKFVNKELNDLGWFDLKEILTYLSSRIDLDTLIKEEPKLSILKNQDKITLRHIEVKKELKHKSFYKSFSTLLDIKSFLDWCEDDDYLDDGSMYFVDSEGYVIDREESFPYVRSEQDKENWIKSNPEVKEVLYFSK